MPKMTEEEKRTAKNKRNRQYRERARQKREAELRRAAEGNPTDKPARNTYAKAVRSKIF